MPTAPLRMGSVPVAGQQLPNFAPQQNIAIGSRFVVPFVPATGHAQPFLQVEIFTVFNVRVK